MVPTPLSNIYEALNNLPMLFMSVWMFFYYVTLFSFSFSPLSCRPSLEEVTYCSFQFNWFSPSAGNYSLEVGNYPLLFCPRKLLWCCRRLSSSNRAGRSSYFVQMRAISPWVAPKLAIFYGWTPYSYLATNHIIVWWLRVESLCMFICCRCYSFWPSLLNYSSNFGFLLVYGNKSIKDGSPPQPMPNISKLEY